MFIESVTQNNHEIVNIAAKSKCLRKSWYGSHHIMYMIIYSINVFSMRLMPSEMLNSKKKRIFFQLVVDICKMLTNVNTLL